MIATYRLQLHPEFGFSDVEALVPYFARLGVSHLYLSPITRAQAGSLHGYDVTDHNAVRDELGGEEGFERLREAACAAGLGLILDFVPNHAGVGAHNAFWQDVLAHGPSSPHADFFDIDWDPLEDTLQDRILLPFLGQPYGEALDDGEITLVYEARDEAGDGARGSAVPRFYAAYYDDRFALQPASYASLLAHALPHYERTDVYFDLKDLLRDYRSLQPGEVPKAEMLARRLHALSDRVDWQAHLSEIQGEALHALLEDQHWRLAYWKTAGYEINYRRFFDINALVGLRMEDETVFWSAHRLLGHLLTREGVDGVRIDHVDGLFDPHGYLERLRRLGARHVWVEKILAPGEVLPEAWPVAGTTGYEFMNDVLHLLADAEGLAALERQYARFVPVARSFEDEAHRSKMLVMETSLSSELTRLAHELNEISKADYHTRDYTLGALRVALAEVAAAMRRYRTYLPHDEEQARELVQEALYRARQHTPAFEPSIYEHVGRVILGDVREDLLPAQRRWAGRFQQYTAPVAAKGVEDTTFYRYLPLVALNEVGGEPALPAQPLQAFHSHARFRAQRYPDNLLSTATHDHKRGEDTRMRMLALTARPEAWELTVRSLVEIGEAHRDMRGPSKYDEYLFYQVLAALCHPGDEGRAGADAEQSLEDRLWAYMQKASRESKRTTSWESPDEAYEAALEAFVRGMTGDPRTAEALDAFAAEIAAVGFRHTLTQTLVKFTTPGVPDVYQGTELFDLSLVDPDNRRAVDFGRREAVLASLADAVAHPTPERVDAIVAAADAQTKAYFIARLLHLRRERPALFAEGGYAALNLEGEGAEEWIAFSRDHGDARMIVVAPLRPEPSPATLELPDGGAWTEALTGTPIAHTDALTTEALPMPWAVLLNG